jgi:hypothetical protein
MWSKRESTLVRDTALSLRLTQHGMSMSGTTIPLNTV